MFRMIAPNGLAVKLDQDVYVNFMLDNSILFDQESKDYISRYNEAEFIALRNE